MVFGIEIWEENLLICWIQKRIIIFDISISKVKFQYDFEGPILGQSISFFDELTRCLDLKLWQNHLVIMIEKKLKIVKFNIEGPPETIYEFILNRRPTSLKVIENTAFVADRSGDAYQVIYPLLPRSDPLFFSSK